MKKVELDLNEETVRMIKAYKALTDQPTDSIIGAIGVIIENGIRNMLAEALGFAAGERSFQPYKGCDMGPLKQALDKADPLPSIENDDHDITDISTGLGDKDEYEEGVTEPMEIPSVKDTDALLPDEARPSEPSSVEQAMATDLNVNDPEVEAAAEPTFADQMSETTPSVAADNFATLAGFGEVNPNEQDIDPRIARRKKPPLKKGKVSLIMEDDKGAF